MWPRTVSLSIVALSNSNWPSLSAISDRSYCAGTFATVLECLSSLVPPHAASTAANTASGMNLSSREKGFCIGRFPREFGGEARRVSGLRQRDAALALVFAAAVAVADVADFVGLQEQHLRHAFVGVDLRRQRRGVGELQRHVTFPFGF